jgi:tetratricopeptide (TPR) repeat protein
VWIEQGIAGAFALLLAGLVVLGWAWRALGHFTVPSWGWAGLAALCAVFLHGLVDVVFYVSRTLPIIGFVLGFAYWVNFQYDSALKALEQTRLVQQFRRLLAASLAAFLVIAFLIVFYKPAKAAWFANYGAIKQSYYELSVYDPLQFENRPIDAIRKEMASPYLQAELSYQNSLEFNPVNRTALQRLASLAFSRDNYEKSLEYTQKLWQAGLRDPTTRILYAEALIANEQASQAANILSGVPWGEYHVMGTAWYRYWLSGDYERAVYAWSTALLLNPENEQAARWLKEAQEKLK